MEGNSKKLVKRNQFAVWEMGVKLCEDMAQYEPSRGTYNRRLNKLPLQIQIINAMASADSCSSYKTQETEKKKEKKTRDSANAALHALT